MDKLVKPVIVLMVVVKLLIYNYFAVIQIRSDF